MMVNVIESPKATSPVSKLPETREKKHFQVINRTYQNNLDSDYTEKIETLGKTFDYSSNSAHFWGDPELSMFYGTPLHEVCSDSQKLALNHLYWVGQYHHTAEAESNTMLFNQVTAGVFSTVSGYETLCQELDFETSQERYHIGTFQKIGYRTKLALLGKESLSTPLGQKLGKQVNGKYRQLGTSAKPSFSMESLQESTLRSITKLMHWGKQNHYSQYLQAKANEPIPTATGGLAGVTAPPSMFKFLTLNWGTSPFMAAQYYSARMIANMSLKTYEHSYYKSFKDLEKTGEFVPAPIAVSYYHLLDEAFHTTMSQTIAQDVYRDFAKPTAYEKLLSNVIIYRLQIGLLGGLSGAMPAVFRDDACFMVPFYRLLTSPLFGMSSQDALYWMEKSLCHEHDGFHVNLKYHQTLLSDLRRFFDQLEYLWPINREMRLMAGGQSVERAIQRNISAFKQFSQSMI
jgi:hypothetical protein